MFIESCLKMDQTHGFIPFWRTLHITVLYLLVLFHEFSICLATNMSGLNFTYGDIFVGKKGNLCKNILTTSQPDRQRCPPRWVVLDIYIYSRNIFKMCHLSLKNFNLRKKREWESNECPPRRVTMSFSFRPLAAKADLAAATLIVGPGRFTSEAREIRPSLRPHGTW